MNTTDLELGLVVFITQILHMYFRTINIQHSVKEKVLNAVMSNTAVGILFLFNTVIGVNAFMHFKVWPILGYLIGGGIGTYLGIKSFKSIKGP